MSTSEIHVMRGNCRYSEILYGAILATVPYPDSILELGCGVGRNLSMFTHATCRVGVEPYVYNVLDARRNYPDIEIVHASDQYLSEYKENEFDVAFTCSVLDHIQKWERTFYQMCRIACTTILFEPYIPGQERQALPTETFRWEDTWYHDYQNAVKGTDYFRVTMRDFPLYEHNSGPLFKMMVIE